MLIHCKKTGEKYEITDREIGEKIECPCCGEKFIVDDALLPKDIYEAAQIRKTEALALRDEPLCTLYEHGSEWKYAKLFDSAYEDNDAEAQFQLARWLYDCEQEYLLAEYWFGRAAKRKHAEANRRLEECHKHGLGVKQNENGNEVQNHISDLLEWQQNRRSKEDLVTWRESVDMNCPVCDAAMKLPTRLMGDKVRCPHCKGVFMAKGEGIMTTDERNRYRLESRFNEEAETLRARFMSCRSAVESILKKLGVDYDEYNHELLLRFVGDGVGYGNHSPWMGVYLTIEWPNRGFDVRPYLDGFRNVIESVLGFWVRIISCHTSSGLGDMCFYIRHDRPCRQNVAFKREIEGRMLAPDSQNKAQHPLVMLRKAEAERLEYLLHGELAEDFLATRNSFPFNGYLRNKYPDTGLFVQNCNLPPGEPWCVARGLNDGFGIIVHSKKILTNEVLSKIIQDVERRCSRKLSFVRRSDIDGDFNYSFKISMPNQGATTQLRLPTRTSMHSKIAAGQGTAIAGKSAHMKQTTTSVLQHLGKGTGVDWTKENRVFSEMIAKHGIRKFHVEMPNPYCAEVSIPMTEDEDVVCDFANDLFHALDILDAGYDLDVGQLTACSGIDINEEEKCYYVFFNHHDVAECNPGDARYKYKVEAMTANEEGAGSNGGGGDEAEKIMQAISYAIKSGQFRSKSGEGYFVLKGEFYDAIKAGRKTTEYRDLSPRNLSLSIGIKTVKLQRGYGHPGQPPEQMRFEVKSVRLMDANDRECDPFAIPSGFLATTIAIHLGRRIG